MALLASVALLILWDRSFQSDKCSEIQRVNLLLSFTSLSWKRFHAASATCSSGESSSCSLFTAVSMLVDLETDVVDPSSSVDDSVSVETAATAAMTLRELLISDWLSLVDLLPVFLPLTIL